jgi:hypothetical protein
VVLEDHYFPTKTQREQSMLASDKKHISWHCHLENDTPRKSLVYHPFLCCEQRKAIGGVQPDFGFITRRARQHQSDECYDSTSN